MILARFLAFAMAIAWAGAAWADGLPGRWSGSWTKAGDALPVATYFEQTEDGYRGSFDSDALHVAGIPFQTVTADGARIKFTLAGDATTTLFEGDLAGDALAGELTEGGVKGSFELRRAEAPPPVTTRPATFDNGDVTLAGELLLPEREGRHPAIIFLHGSGDEGRWASRYLARRFAERDYVALIYDKRGVGESTGDWSIAGFDTLAADAMAGLEFLAAQPEVDPARIGVYGHSQGGWVAAIVAARMKSLAFVIGSAASGLDPAQTETYSVRNSIDAGRLAPQERADAERYVAEVVAVAYKGKSRDDLDAMAKKYGSRAWYFDPPPPDDRYWTFSRRAAEFRPTEYWRNVRAPVLLTYGAEDERVPAEASAEAILGALKDGGNKSASVRIFPGADHAYWLVEKPPGAVWPRRVPDYVETLLTWADGH